MEGYRWFDLCSRQLRNLNGPYWRFHRHLSQELSTNYRTILALNLLKVDVEGGSPYGTSECESILQAQSATLSEEIRILKPNVIVFLTSWRKDEILRQELPGAQFSAALDDNIHLLARIDGVHAGQLMFRTYHPGFLNRLPGTRDRVLTTIVNGIREMR
jgi:uracil-DNA glycosylase